MFSQLDITVWLYTCQRNSSRCQRRFYTASLPPPPPRPPLCVSHPTFTRSHYMASLYFSPSVLAAAPLGKGSLDYTLRPNDLNHRKKKMNTEEVKMKSEPSGPRREPAGTSSRSAEPLHAWKDSTSIRGNSHPSKPAHGQPGTGQNPIHGLQTSGTGKIPAYFQQWENVWAGKSYLHKSRKTLFPSSAGNRSYSQSFSKRTRN